MLNQLLHSKTGFPWSVRAAAFLSLGCFVLGHSLIFIPPIAQNQAENSKPTKNIVYLQDLPYMLTLASGFVGQLGTYFPSFYVQLFAENHNVSKTLTFYSLAILNLASCVGRIVPNYFADRWGPVEVFIVCCGLSGTLRALSTFVSFSLTLISGFVGFAMLGCGTSVGLVLFCILCVPPIVHLSISVDFSI